MLSEIIVATGVALIAYVFYNLFTKSARYFEERNLKYRGAFAHIKSLLSTSFGRTDVLSMTLDSYAAFPDESIYGAFDFSVRQYIVRDPEVFKRIAVKDFDHFEDHRKFLDNGDVLFENSLFSMEGEKWRQMRAQMSPAFTGSKMRQMFVLISECADEIAQHFRQRAAGGEKLNLEMKDFFSRYCNDVIATTAFGIKVNSFADPDNEFFVSGKKIMNFCGGFVQILKLLVAIVAPKIFKMLNLQLFDASVTNFFKSMVLDTMSEREKSNIFRPDMINMLMQVRKGDLKHQAEEATKDGFATVEESDIGKAAVTRKWSDNEIISQAFVFFFAGFEMPSGILTFIAYEIVANPEVQQKLYEEIAKVNEELDGKPVTYDALQKMKYLDQVVSEALRKWPGAVHIERICVKDYIYDDGKRKFQIEKGASVIFLTMGVHRDDKYFPAPEKFDPDRFSDENKHDILAGSFAPFGVGPRSCIGSRFALMELKAILYSLLLNFSFEANENTQIPLKMKKGPVIAIENGVHLELKPRQ